MKHFLIILLTLPCLLNAQVKEDGDAKTLAFAIGHHVNDSIRFGNQLDIKTIRPMCIFTLAGTPALQYRLTLVNDTVANLDKYTTEWQFQEDFPIDAGYMEVQNDTLFAPYTIYDFDQDGDEDLVCWLSSNMNGNRWSSIYLNDPHQQKLVQLYNTAENTYVWDAPDYDPATGNITCTLLGSAFSNDAQSHYKLAGLTAVPLTKQAQERSYVPYIFDYEYIGENSRWKQVTQEVSIVLKANSSSLFYELEKHSSNDALTISKYSVADTQTEPVLQETVTFYDWLGYGDVNDDDFYTSFEVTDFNKDGNEDLILKLYTDVHGSRRVIIFLHDDKSKKLVKLYNTAEATDEWSSPEYNAKTKIITSYLIGGNASESYTSTYRLKGFSAEPLKKEVKDRTNVNAITGKGYSESTYTGKKGKWVLQRTVKE
jgi:hypothetical protein